MKTRIKDIGEISLIKRLAKTFRLDRSVIKGPGDDAAVLRWTRGKHLLFTCDMVIEEKHFTLSGATPFQAGWKALGRNISDVAAMGGVPRYAVVSLGIDPESDVRVAEGICRGLKSMADRFGVNIVGGDVAGSKRIIIDVSLIGEVERNRLVLRSGARPGDLILVTGALGGSIKGRHLDFIPRVKEARFLTGNFKINSMIDISDGLVLDLSRVLKASNRGAYIYEGAIPLSRHAASSKNALYDGEDYELLFTMSAEEARKLFRRSAGRKTGAAVIGEVTERKYGFNIVKNNGKMERISPKGYLHF